MHFQYLKAAQVVVLVLTAVHFSSLPLLIITIALTLYTANQYFITTTASIIASFIPYFMTFELFALLPAVVNLSIELLMKRMNNPPTFEMNRLSPLFLICFGLTTINSDKMAADLQLAVFFIMLVLCYLNYANILMIMIKIVRWIIGLELLLFGIYSWSSDTFANHSILQNNSGWYYISFALSTLFCTFIAQQNKSIHPDDRTASLLRRSRGSSILSIENSIEIQMQEIPKNNNQKQLEAMMQEKKQQNQKIQAMEQFQKYQELGSSKRSIEADNVVELPQGAQSEQSQSLNLLLVIPFCMLGEGWTEILIYIYILSLQWSFSRKWLFVMMLLSLYQISSHSRHLLISLTLRIFSVLLVTKNVHGGYELGELVKVIWLRTSFAFVLSLLFWFSLLTVNIFHLLFIAIILLFITRDSKPHTVSYRHKNWKYLLFLFNLFLVLRYIYQIAILRSWQSGQYILSFLQLTGISYYYSQSPQFFNLIPLIINAILGLQFLTYNSKIYSIHSKSTMLQSYRTIFNKFAGVLTIFYYKLLPWASYFGIIVLLLALQSAASTFILLAWVLLTLSLHILSRNDLPGYRRLHLLWLAYARLTSLQIVLRYIFQFAKFDLLSFLRSLPFFQTLLRYEQFLGLAIRDPEQVYLKTVTKFQLMVSLDLMAIFIAFLVTQYYNLLIKYKQLPPQQSWGQLQKRINQVYKDYVDFKITAWLRKFPLYKALKYFCSSYIEIFFPAIGLFACFHYSLLMFFYVLLSCFYFLALNLKYYETHVESGTAHAVIRLVIHWRAAPVAEEAELLKNKLSLTSKFMTKFKIQEHAKLRPFLVLVTVVAILLTYISRMLGSDQVRQIIGQQLVLYLRWCLYVGGCSIQQGFSAHASKILLLCLVLEMKCCWFINKFNLASQSKPNQNQQVLIEDVLTNQELSLQDVDANSLHPPSNLHHEGDQSEVDMTEGEELRLGQKEVLQMRISLWLGVVKLLERSFVMVLVFASIVEGSHPFGIAYLLCAILLNYLGSVSIKALSRLLSTLILLEYALVLVNYSNSSLFQNLPQQFAPFQSQTILRWLFNLPSEWQWYLTFGKSSRQLGMIALSWIVLISYQCYFLALKASWLKIISLLEQGLSVGNITRRILQHVRQVYEYGLTYSPIVVMLLCLVIYLLDYTTTNLVLTTLTTTFVFVSFLLRDYRDSRHFWRSYFIILQLMIVCFMLIYALLQLPMLSSLCSRLLCSQEKLHTQIYKALLLLILQLGLDLTNSHHFDRALKHLDHSRSRLQLQRLAIAYRQNDRKILQKFKQLKRQQQLLQTVDEVVHFLQDLKKNPQLQFEGKGQNYQSKESWLDVFLQFLPSLIDEHLLINQKQAKHIVEEQNRLWMKIKEYSQTQLSRINDSYIDALGELEGDMLDGELKNLLRAVDQSLHPHQQKGVAKTINIQEAKRLEEERERQRQMRDMGFYPSQISKASSQGQSNQKSQHQKLSHHVSDFSSYRPPAQNHFQSHHLQQDLTYSERKSYINDQLPMQSNQMMMDIRQSMRGQKNQKEQLVYLLLAESVLSNWQYITYLILVLIHVRNMGLLTFPLPAVTFFFGLVSSYQAGKQVWRWLFVFVLIPLLFKFGVKVGLLTFSEEIVYLMVGDNLNSVLLQFLGIVFIVGQCVILKMIGHFHQTTQQIQCMKMALIRNIINHQKKEQRPLLFTLLKQGNKIPTSYFDFLFGVTECKPGYDYSTLLTTLQLSVLVWVFLFYDRMAVRQQVTFYQMIQYNQFSSGMVALVLVQLVFLLSERFIAIADLKQASVRWDLGLLLKYCLLVLHFLVIQCVILLYFPLSSGLYQSNTYVVVLLILSLFSLLVESLQVKKGLDQASRGFMDRYTWYNGFVYIGFRAIPFLFQFKAFSDWTFTKTALRIFDWIRLQQIFGRLYVAKCNALFLSGKLMGSKIQWWKKLLMGYPLLLSIILLLFGPLVLFSSLNPLASYNDVTAGYLQIVLRVNKTNEYPLYTNSHITDIHRLQPNFDEQQLLNSYDIDPLTVQILHLQQFSDQYWEISQGSYYKLLAQAEESLYDLTVRAKFDRNQTGLTSLYVLSSYQIPNNRIPQLKNALLGKNQFCVNNLLNTFLRLDNNNGLHELGDDLTSGCLRATAGVRATKQYWVFQGGLKLRIASDKYTKAIFGYSVMSFYISIILVIANYFRFLFQGSVHTIITADIPHPDPVLALCNAVYRARRIHDLQNEERLFWSIIDLLRSPDSLKSLTGNYLQARLDTLKQNQQLQKIE